MVDNATLEALVRSDDVDAADVSADMRTSSLFRRYVAERFATRRDGGQCQRRQRHSKFYVSVTSALTSLLFIAGTRRFQMGGRTQIL